MLDSRLDAHRLTLVQWAKNRSIGHSSSAKKQPLHLLHTECHDGGVGNARAAAKRSGRTKEIHIRAPAVNTCILYMHKSNSTKSRCWLRSNGASKSLQLVMLNKRIIRKNVDYAEKNGNVCLALRAEIVRCMSFLSACLFASTSRQTHTQAHTHTHKPVQSLTATLAS